MGKLVGRKVSAREDDSGTKIEEDNSKNEKKNEKNEENGEDSSEESLDMGALLASLGPKKFAKLEKQLNRSRVECHGFVCETVIIK